MNRASAWPGQAREIVLDGEIAVPDDRGAPGTGRLEPE
jgi:hypothetical protein